MPASAEADMSRRVVAHLLACYKDRGGHAILLKENAALRAHAAGLAESCARLGRAAATLSEKQSGAPPPRAHEDEGGLLGKCFSSGFGQKEDIEELAGLAEELRSRLEAAQVAVKAGEARAAGLE